MEISEIIHDRFYKQIDKETHHKISLLNHSLYGTLIDEDYSFNFPKIADEVREILDSIPDINNKSYYNNFMEYWYVDKNDNLISNEWSLDIQESDKYEDIYEIQPEDILKTILGGELYDTIY
jgi:phage terminase Nu1 subunit (DNA packaging protein)